MKKKALIVCGKLSIGGAEKVAYLIGKYAANYNYECHYIVFEDYVGEYEKELVDEGCRIFHLSVPRSDYKAYWKKLNELIEKYEYEVVHCHTMFNSGIVLAAAKRWNVPHRIAHSHSICSSKNRKMVKRIYEQVMRCVIRSSGTHYVGCGKKAGEWLFGQQFYEKNGITILNGVNTKLFQYSEESRRKIRKDLNIEEKFVIGHVGHLQTVKNQKFLLNMMPEVLKRNSEAVLLLLGDGQDRKMLEGVIQELHLEEHVIMTGNVMNVHEYLSAMDVFVFPSLYEGMPLSILEVQSNGLPCVISDAVPKDVHLTDLLTVLSLEDSQNEWIKAALSAKRINPESYGQYMYESGYDTETMIQKIFQLYE